VKFLVDEGLYESKEETMRREEVVVRIDQVIKSVWFIAFS
jgi:poly(A) polymerase